MPAVCRPYAGRMPVRVCSVFERIARVYRCRTGEVTRGHKDGDRRVSVRYTLGPTISRPRLTPNVPEKAGHGVPWHPGINDASGVAKKAAPGGPERPIVQHQGSGNRRRRDRQVEAAAARERAAVRSEAEAEVPAPVRAVLHGAVRSEVRACSAGARARAKTPARRVVHGVVRSPVRGAAGTGDARSAPGRSRGDARSRRSRRGRARRGPRRARRAAPARG